MNSRNIYTDACFFRAFQHSLIGVPQALGRVHHAG